MQNVMQNIDGFNSNIPIKNKYGYTFTIERKRCLSNDVTIAPIYGEKYSPAFINSLAILIENGDIIEYTEYPIEYGWEIMGTLYSKKLNKTFQIGGKRGYDSKYPTFKLL